jgi:hypothetical protein
LASNTVGEGLQVLPELLQFWMELQFPIINQMAVAWLLFMVYMKFKMGWVKFLKGVKIDPHPLK